MITAANVINALTQYVAGTVPAASDDPALMLFHKIKPLLDKIRRDNEDLYRQISPTDSNSIAVAVKEIFPKHEDIVPGRVAVTMALFYHLIENRAKNNDYSFAYEIAYVATILFRQTGVEEYVENQGGLDRVLGYRVRD